MSRRKPSELPAVLMLLPVLVVIVGPFLWLIVSSLKTEREIGRGDPFSFPAQLMWQNYIDAWNIGNFGSLIGNSLINVLGVVTLTLLVCAPAGYALAKIRFPGREWVFYAFIFGLTIPVQAVIIPLYQLLSNLGMINSLWGVTLAQVSNGIPFGLFLMRSFFMGVPNELTEAAKIDGANAWQRFTQITLPLMRRTLALALILSVAGSILAFDQFYIMLRGGPRNSTITAVYWIFNQSFVSFKLGYGAALSMVLLVILVVLSLIQLRLLRNPEGT